MPRTFDSDEHDGDTLLTFTEVVTCPKCGTEQQGFFTDDSMSVEDMVEPPKTEQECEVCLHHWVAEYQGWANYGDA